MKLVGDLALVVEIRSRNPRRRARKMTTVDLRVIDLVTGSHVSKYAPMAPRLRPALPGFSVVGLQPSCMPSIALPMHGHAIHTCRSPSTPDKA